jgi:inorganic pyrophosphatase
MYNQERNAGASTNNIQDANPVNTPNGSDSTKPQASAPSPVVPGARIEFPYDNSRRRLGDYEYFMRLFMGEHFEAFNIRINDEKYTKEYSKLRYIMVNFAGLISKVVADFLFSEPPKFYSDEGDDAQTEYLEALIHENNLNAQNYESALSNSALGDAVYKIRIGERVKGDGKPTVIIEDFTPSIFFPKVEGFNVRQTPDTIELAWTFFKGKDKYLRKEIHTIGKIENQVWSMEGNKIMTKQDVSILGDPDLKEFEDTKIDRHLIVHIPNWKTGNRFFGISDYADLDKLFYAVNNRFTKIDNILDKHGDPILTVPQGVLDEKGNVNKKSLGVIEIVDGDTGKPEYIVWDAKLESAFSEIEKLTDMVLMIAEISPDVLGMGKGITDSGRALKLKILRTIAKVARKKLYYDRGLKEVLYTAMLVAKAHNVKVGDLDPIDPFVPEIEWQDGMPIDMAEQVDIEAKRLDSGTTTKADAIGRLDGVDEETAQKKAAAIKDENAIAMPVST